MTLTIALCLVLIGGLAIVAYACRSWLALYWRTLLSRLPLPMLALAASYGVYRFALMYTPPWVAIAQAAAFEMTYIGLAVLDGLDDDERKRATLISVGSVGVSIIYNTIAGVAHQQPDLFVNLDRTWLWTLGFLHGAPLAIVAYFVADLLLHRKPARKETGRWASRRKPIGNSNLKPAVYILRKEPARLVDNAKSKAIQQPIDDKTIEVVRLRDEEKLSFSEIGQQLGFSRQAAQQRYRIGKGV